MMKILLAAAAFGLTASAAYACPGHDVHASSDKKMTVASVETEATPMTTAEAPSMADAVATGTVEADKAD